MNSTIELLAPRYDIAWYPWAVQYFFMIAVSYASLWLAAPAHVLHSSLASAPRWSHLLHYLQIYTNRCAFGTFMLTPTPTRGCPSAAWFCRSISSAYWALPGWLGARRSKPSAMRQG